MADSRCRKDLQTKHAQRSSARLPAARNPSVQFHLLAQLADTLLPLIWTGLHATLEQCDHPFAGLALLLADLVRAHDVLRYDLLHGAVPPSASLAIRTLGRRNIRLVASIGSIQP